MKASPAKHAMSALLLLCTLIEPACFLQPEGGAGDGCACSGECGDDLYCSVESEPSEIDGSCSGESGVCRAFRHDGESCSDDSDDPLRCAAPLICRPLDHVCGERISEGLPCEGKKSFECAIGLTCDLGLDPPQCVTPQPAGEPCGNDNDCSSGLSCNAGVDPHVCSVPHSGTRDEPCGKDEDCISDLVCCTACEATTCVEAFSGAPTSPCNRDLDCASHHCITWSDGDQGTWIGECG